MCLKLNKIYKKFLLVSIILNYLVLQLNCAESWYQDEKQLFEAIDWFYNRIDDFYDGLNSSSSLLDTSGSSHESPHKCSKTQLIDQLFESILPDDYEEGQKMDINYKVKTQRELNERIERLSNWGSNITKKFQPILNRLQMRLTESLLLIDLPDQCLQSIARIAMAIGNKEKWALQFLESIPQPIDGLMPSTDYDNCLQIKSPRTEENLPDISGKYCPLDIPNVLPTREQYNNQPLSQSVVDKFSARLLKMSQKNKINLKTGDRENRMAKFEFTKHFLEDIIISADWSKPFRKLPVALCIPTSCSAQDIESALNKALYPVTQFPIVLNPDCDYLDKPMKINEHQWNAIYVFSFLIFMVFLSTAYLLHKRLFTNEDNKPNNSMISQISQSFCAISNFKAIFWWDRPNKKFRVFDGLRAILAFVVLLCHELEVSILHSKGRTFLSKVYFGKNYIFVKNISLIDTFFFLGGLMTCYVMLSKLHKSKGKFNYFQYVVFRYLRIIPVTLGSILLIFIYPLLGNGPNWSKASSLLYLPCRDNWLPGVLMTSNFDLSIPEKFICNIGNWSISTDFQLYLVAPIVFLVFYYSPKFGVIWNIILIGVGVFICIAPRVIWDIPYILEFPPMDHIWEYTFLVKQYYWRADPHFVSYVLGMLCGYLIRQKPDMYLGGRIGELVLWITCSALTFWSMWWNNYLFDPFIPVTSTEIVLFLAFSKLLYLSGWFWMAYACVTGRGGFVNSFFSWKVFKPFGFLSFEICVVSEQKKTQNILVDHKFQMMIVLYRVGTDREQVIYSSYYVWTKTCFDFLATFLFSIIFYVIASGPFTNLVNILVKKDTRSSERTKLRQ